MNLDLLFAIIFYGILYSLFFIYRKKFEVQGRFFILYKTKLGLKAMNSLSKKFPRFLNFLSYISILVGFTGMIFIFYILLKGTYNLIIQPSSTPVLSPVLPGIEIPGLPILSFWHWIIAILFVAIIHEFSHGVYAKLSNIKIKSSGFALLGPILAAFVEPDEKQLSKSSHKKQLSVLSAGPFSNIIVGIILLLISGFLLTPIASSMVEHKGVQVVQVAPDYPLSTTQIKPGDILKKIGNKTLNDPGDFVEAINSYKPGDKIKITTNKSSYTVILTEHPQNSSLPYLGVMISPESTNIKRSLKEKNPYLPSIFIWIVRLFFWLYVISIGIGLFNLLPLGPVDGGRMFHILSMKIFKNKTTATKVYHLISMVCLILIFINLLPYIIKLINFILSPILALI